MAKCHWQPCVCLLTLKRRIGACQQRGAKRSKTLIDWLGHDPGACLTLAKYFALDISSRYAARSQRCAPNRSESSGGRKPGLEGSSGARLTLLLGRAETCSVTTHPGAANGSGLGHTHSRPIDLRFLIVLL